MIDIEGLLSELYGCDALKRDEADRLLSDFQNSEGSCAECCVMLRSGKLSVVSTQYCLGVLLRTARIGKWKQRVTDDNSNAIIQHLMAATMNAATPTPIQRKGIDLLVAIAFVSESADLWGRFSNWCATFVSPSNPSPPSIGWLVKSVCLELTTSTPLSPSSRLRQIRPAVEQLLSAALPIIINRFAECGDNQLCEAISLTVPLLNLDELLSADSSLLSVFCLTDNPSLLDLQLKISCEVFDLRTFQPKSGALTVFHKCVGSVLSDCMLRHPDKECLVRCIQTLVENHISREVIGHNLTQIFNVIGAVLQSENCPSETLLESYFSTVDCVCQYMIEEGAQIDVSKELFVKMFDGIVSTYAPSVHSVQLPTDDNLFWYSDVSGSGVLAASKIASLFADDFLTRDVLARHVRRMNSQICDQSLDSSQRIAMCDCLLQLLASLAPDMIPYASAPEAIALLAQVFTDLLGNTHIFESPLLAYRCCGVASAYVVVFRKLDQQSQKQLLDIISDMTTYIISKNWQMTPISEAASNMIKVFALKAPKIVSESQKACLLISKVFEQVPITEEYVGLFAAAIRVLLASRSVSDVQKLFSRMSTVQLGITVATSSLDEIFNEGLPSSEKNMLWKESGLDHFCSYVLTNSSPQTLTLAITLFQCILKHLHKQMGDSAAQNIIDQLLRICSENPTAHQKELLLVFLTEVVKIPSSPFFSFVVSFAEDFSIGGEPVEVVDSYISLLMAVLENDNINKGGNSARDSLLSVLVSAFAPDSGISPSLLFTLCTWMLQMDVEVLSPQRYYTLSYHILERKCMSDVHGLLYAKVLHKLPSAAMVDIIGSWLSSKVPRHTADQVLALFAPQVSATITKFTAAVDEVVGIVKQSAAV